MMRENPRLSAAFPRDSDSWIRQASLYQAAYAECHDDVTSLMLLRRRWRDLYLAHRIRLETTEYGWLRRSELEARILARDTPEIILDRVQVEPKVADWYEKLFFHVTDRLQSKGWIAHSVMGASYHAGLTERDHDLLWKIFGYCGGPAVLDLVIDKDLTSLQPKRGDDMGSYTSDHAKNTAALRSMLALRTAPLDRNNWNIIVEIHQRFIELKQQAEGEGSGARDVFNAHIKEMLESIPWVLGGHPREKGGYSPVIMVDSKDPKHLVGKLPPTLIEADQRGRELRAEELHEITHGQEITWLGEETQGSTFQKRQEEDENGDDAAYDEGV